MFGLAWLAHRQIREALQTGRLEEAARLLHQSPAKDHKRTWQLRQELIRRFVERAERHLRHDAIVAAWDDLQQVELWAPNDPVVDQLRQRLVKLGLAEARAALEIGRPGRASEALARLRDRGVKGDELHPLDEAARFWLLAREYADHGDFAAALKQVERIAKILPPPTPGLDEFRAQLQQRHEAYQQSVLSLHEAYRGRRWREVVQWADGVLAVAPQAVEARKLRGDAWKAIEPESTKVTMLSPCENGAVHTPSVESRVELPRRLLLWIDGVGGYLICLSSRVTLGQATGDAPVDVPLLADVSRLHATVSRDEEGYLLEAARPVLVNGRPETRTILQPNDRLTLGTSCQFLFQKPVPVSATARLEMVSGHRLPLSVSAVVLMADSLVLGSSGSEHISLPDVDKPLIMYRSKEGLGLRFPGEFFIDGKKYKENGCLGLQATARGPGFALAIEPAAQL
jgi:tetratricopeptide (TPR) repeat protein